MFLFNIFQQLKRLPNPRKPVRSFQPTLESLEPRLVLSAVSVLVSASPALPNTNVLLIARVTDSGTETGTPVGTVSFTCNGTLSLGSSTLAANGTTGVAQLNTSLLPLGVDTITADYLGSGTFAGGTATTTETVESWSLTTQSATIHQDATENIGETTVDLLTGSMQIDQYIDFTRSDTGAPGPVFGLVYSSAAADPILQITGTLSPTPSSAPAPSNIGVITALDGMPVSMTFVANPTFEVNVPLGSASTGLLGDTGPHTWGGTLDVTLGVGGATETITASGSVYVDDERNSPYGVGWGLEGVNQLESLSNGELWLNGTGSASLFSGTPSSGATFGSPVGDFGTLTEGAGGFTYTGADGSEVLFNAAGYETAYVCAAGAGSYSFAYNSSHDLTLVTAPDGADSTLAYNGSGLLTSIIEPGGTVTLQDDGTGHLTKIIESNGSSRSMAYSNNLLTLDQWAPYTATIDYNSGSGEVIGASFGTAAGFGLTAAMLGAGTATLKDGNGNATQFVLDNAGRVLEEIQPGSLTQSFGYNTSGEQTLSSDGNGNATTEQWSNGNLTKVIDPDGGTYSYGYDPTFNQMTLAIDADGNTTSWTLDSLGEVLSETAGVGSAIASTWSYSWSAGLMISEIDADGNTLSMGYNALRQLTHEEIFDSGGTIISNESMSYNSAGWLSLTTEGIGGTGTSITLASSFDAGGQLLTEVDGAGNTITNTWFASGLLESSTDGRSVTVDYIYDDAGNLTEQLSDVGTANPETLLQTFDQAGNLTTIKEVGGLTLVDSYNSDDWLTKELSYDSLGTQIGSMSFAYDNSGNVTLTVDGAGNETKDIYDSMDRLTTQAVYDSANTLIASFSQVWDKNGNLTTFTDGAGNETIDVYDAQGRLSTETVEDSALNVITKESMAYDGNGNVTSTTDGVGNVTTERYDGNELVEEKVADSLGAIFSDYSYQYNLDDFLTLTTDALSNTTSDTYNGDGAVLTEVVKDAGGTTVSSMSSSYDADNDVLTETDGAGNETLFTYNNDDLLVSAVTLDSALATIGWQSFGYDTLQDQTLSNMGGGLTNSETFDGGELTKEVVLGTGGSTMSVESFGYDQAGEQTLTTEGGSITISDYFDGGNLTREVTLDSGGSTLGLDSYGYDLAGEQTLMIQGGSITISDSYDGGELTKEVTLDSGGSTVGLASYGYDLAGEQTLMVQGGSVTMSDSYDGGMVTKDVLTGSGGGTVSWSSFGYDSNGEQTLMPQGGSITISDSYDGGNPAIPAER